MLIKNYIFTNTLGVVFVIGILWLIIYSLLKWFDLSEINWKRLELVFVFTGLLAVISIVERNKKSINEYDASNLNARISMTIDRIKFYTANSCFKYQKSEFSPPDLKYRQLDQDLICGWAKNFHIDSINNFPIQIDTVEIKSILFNTDEMDYYKSEFLKSANEVNSDILQYNLLIKNIHTNDWENMLNSLGLLFLILSISIKLSITSHNIYLQKKLKN